MTEITYVGGNFYPQANSLNDSGEVVGQYYLPAGGWRAAIWRNGVVTALPLLPGTLGGSATSINNAGQVVGACDDFVNGISRSRPCIWENGTVRLLPTLPGSTNSYATSINDSGQVVGSAWSPARSTPAGLRSGYDAVLWRGDQVFVLSAPAAGAETQARAINAAGEVACTWMTSSFSGYPSRWTPETVNGTTGTMVALDSNGGWVNDINDAGSIIGSDSSLQPVVWGRSGKTVLPLLPGHQEGEALVLNDADTIAGISVAMEGTEEEPYETHTPTVWDAAHGARDLNTLFTAGDAGPIYAPLAINRQGQILASTMGSRYVLLSPSGLPPAPPYLFAYGQVSEVLLGWHLAPGATSYALKRGTASGGPYTTIAQGLTTPTYVDRDVVNNTRYFYVVTSAGVGGESLPSDEVVALAGLEVPLAWGAEAGDRVVTVYWGATSTAASYAVKRSMVSGGPYSTIAIGVTGSGYVDRAVANGTRYYYVVTAVAGSNESLPSSEISALPLAPPLAPTQLAASAAKGKVQLRWTQSTSVQVLRNRIYRSTNPNSGFAVLAEIEAGTAYLDSAVARNVTYYYSVTAVNSNGQEGPYSAVVAARTK